MLVEGDARQGAVQKLGQEIFALLDGVTGLCQVRGALGSCLVVVPRFDGVN
jgi:hypothetical protein